MSGGKTRAIAARPITLWVTAGLLAAVHGAVGAQTLATVHQFRGCCGFGWAVTALEDVDGDGQTDLAIGANEGGQILVYSGRSGALLHTLGLAQSDFGYALADAGDVDGDGRHDVVGGAPAFGGSGTVRVHSGRTGALLLSLSGPRPGARFGVAVSTAGDYNRDGRSDVLVGADGANEAQIISGADGRVLLTLTGDGRFGAGVARLPDTTGDGRDELLVAAPADGPGRVRVYSGATGALLRTLDSEAGGSEFGTAFLASAGDVDADGKADIYVGDFAANNGSGSAYVFSGLDGVRLHLFAGAAREGLGTGRGAGDVDGDGHADLAIGSYTYRSPQAQGVGRVRVFSGRTGLALASYTGTVSGGNFGFDTVGVGDLNGDRRLDLLVSSQPLGEVVVLAGTVDPLPREVIDEGLDGAWYEPATAGQGWLFDVRAADRFLLGAWFTYGSGATATPSKVGHSSQRWLTLQGNYDGSQAQLPIYSSSGGQFDQAGGVSTVQVGRATLERVDCGHLRIDYALDEGLSGSLLLERLLPAASACPASVP